eukprot:TRINITY_DN1452_c0_g1_i2.p2 TRINITY_DN1452_c0_g1~~TRINITY_DN1452_c0_g1_i2.p2  ORF type:complete len:217 (+),score=77.85 TRINITY_DN1452_c0_g1_i2:114-764(+)
MDVEMVAEGTNLSEALLALLVENTQLREQMRVEEEMRKKYQVLSKELEMALEIRKHLDEGILGERVITIGQKPGLERELHLALERFHKFKELYESKVKKLKEELKKERAEKEGLQRLCGEMEQKLKEAEIDVRKERELAKEYRENLHTLQTILENEEAEAELESDLESKTRYSDPERPSVILSAQDIASSILSRSKRPPRGGREGSMSLRKKKWRK